MYFKAIYKFKSLSGSFKPEKIGLWVKFNRHIHVLVIPYLPLVEDKCKQNCIREINPH